MDDIDDIATHILLNVGRIEHCERHPDVLIDTQDDESLDDAYRMASDYAVRHGFSASMRKLLLDSIKNICAAAAIDCPREPCTHRDD